jgi:hypothetical protein
MISNLGAKKATVYNSSHTILILLILSGADQPQAPASKHHTLILTTIQEIKVICYYW